MSNPIEEVELEYACRIFEDRVTYYKEAKHDLGVINEFPAAIAKSHPRYQMLRDQVHRYETAFYDHPLLESVDATEKLVFFLGYNTIALIDWTLKQPPFGTFPKSRQLTETARMGIKTELEKRIAGSLSIYFFESLDFMKKNRKSLSPLDWIGVYIVADKNQAMQLKLGFSDDIIFM
ncbi:hypothetical protein [Rhizobium sp. 2MFCol3.1]|uniref:hypothetical protein n=1 Tax=Rhizobium sp. 2MFCol3.1 TaxID=1246459 RepID=UPI000365827C|nr:hypothetical protein [Rhizobium sp. 2MFCol3.1]